MEVLQNQVKNLSILGSGNVASHIVPALQEAGYSIHQVFSRNLSHARLLAERCSALAVDQLSRIDDQADAYLFMLGDTALAELVEAFRKPGKLVLHTSGSSPLDILRNVSEKQAILYPLQTFTKGKELDLSKTPFFIEASDSSSLEEVRQMALSLSNRVLELDSDGRKQLHLSAMFASNFSNNMYAISAGLMKRAGLSFDLMKELIYQTAEKIGYMDPLRAQTGPAVRNDWKIMEEHLKLLEDFPEYAVIYLEISKNIIRMNAELDQEWRHGGRNRLE